ncbi:MAG: protocatechuate 3,4-dioxygenase subunit beta, partial [Kineosporiaceae bacterium]
MTTRPAPAFQADPPGWQPPLLYPDYQSTKLRAPLLPAAELPQRLTELTGPVHGERPVGLRDHDLTRQHGGEPLGQRIIVHGRLL